MTDSHQPPQEGSGDLADKIVQHLMRSPFDLVDTTRLMRRFRASVTDVQQALQRLERLVPDKGEAPAS
jgi:DNA-binding GntR family transcriptional regulator